MSDDPKDPKKLNFAALVERLGQSNGVTSNELETRDRLDHEAMQMALLPHRLDDWGVESKDKKIILHRPEAKPWRETPATKWARWMAENPETRTLTLWGAGGCGKSLAASLWLTFAARRPIRAHPRMGDTWEWDVRCKFASPGELHRRYGSFQARDQGWAEDLRTARAVVLDDVGTVAYDIRGQLFDVIYERNRRDLLTVITTNLDPESEVFAQRLDLRVVDRIRESGRFASCGSENLRRQP